MTWQDAAFAAGSAFFAAALIPTMRSPLTRVPRMTSIPTAFWIAVFAVTHYSLGLYWACGMEVLAAGCWAWLAWKRAP